MVKFKAVEQTTYNRKDTKRIVSTFYRGGVVVRQVFKRKRKKFGGKA